MDAAETAAARLVDMMSDKLVSDPLHVAAEAVSVVLSTAPDDFTTAVLVQHARSVLPSNATVFEVALTLGMTLALRAVRESVTRS